MAAAAAAAAAAACAPPGLDPRTPPHTLHRFLLKLSLDPDPDWWAKFRREAQTNTRPTGGGGGAAGGGYVQAQTQTQTHAPHQAGRASTGAGGGGGGASVGGRGRVSSGGGAGAYAGGGAYAGAGAYSGTGAYSGGGALYPGAPRTLSGAGGPVGLGLGLGLVGGGGFPGFGPASGAPTPAVPQPGVQPTYIPTTAAAAPYPGEGPPSPPAWPTGAAAAAARAAHAAHAAAMVAASDGEDASEAEAYGEFRRLAGSFRTWHTKAAFARESRWAGAWRACRWAWVQAGRRPVLVVFIKEAAVGKLTGAPNSHAVPFHVAPHHTVPPLEPFAHAQRPRPCPLLTHPGRLATWRCRTGWSRSRSGRCTRPGACSSSGARTGSACCPARSRSGRGTAPPTTSSGCAVGLLLVCWAHCLKREGDGVLDSPAASRSE
jgi:hypothetical protein